MRVDNQRSSAGYIMTLFHLGRAPHSGQASKKERTLGRRMTLGDRDKDTAVVLTMVTKEVRERHLLLERVKEKADQGVKIREAEARISGDLGTTVRDPLEEAEALRPADTVMGQAGQVDQPGLEVQADLAVQADLEVQADQADPMNQEHLEGRTVRVTKEGLGTRTVEVIGFSKLFNS